MRVLIACHHPLLNGPITKSSLGSVEDGTVPSDMVYDYVELVDEATLQEKGWYTDPEVRNVKDYFADMGSDGSNLKRYTDVVTDKIKELRKGLYYSTMEQLRKSIPGHSDTKIYSKRDWSDIPDNTYDFVYTNHCPMYYFHNKNFAILNIEGTLSINSVLQQSLRVLKPGGSLVFPIYPSDETPNNPLRDPALKQPGFKVQYKKLQKGELSKKFPEFCIRPKDWFVGYLLTDNGLTQERMIIDRDNCDFLHSDRIMVKLTKQPLTQDDIESETLAAMRTGGRKTYRMPRKYSKSYCRKTTCRKMGFTQRSSCRPYKNCFRSGRKER